MRALLLAAVILSAAILVANRLGVTAPPLRLPAAVAAVVKPATAPVDPSSVVPHFSSGPRGTFSQMPEGSGLGDKLRPGFVPDCGACAGPAAVEAAEVPAAGATLAPQVPRPAAPGSVPPISPGYVVGGSEKVYIGRERGYRNAERELEWEHARGITHTTPAPDKRLLP
jgi:hypothetical protein